MFVATPLGGPQDSGMVPGGRGFEHYATREEEASAEMVARKHAFVVSSVFTAAGRTRWGVLCEDPKCDPKY